MDELSVEVIVSELQQDIKDSNLSEIHKLFLLMLIAKSLGMPIECEIME